MKKWKIVFWIAIIGLFNFMDVKAQLTCGDITSSDYQFLFQELNANSNMRFVKVNWFHVKTSNGSSSLSDNYIKSLITKVNVEFLEHNIKLVSNCNGIIPVENDGLYATSPFQAGDLCNFPIYCQSGALNVFLIDLSYGHPKEPGYGYSNMGTKLCYVKVKGINGYKTAIHEIGHCLGLFHLAGTRPKEHLFNWHPDYDYWTCNDQRDIKGSFKSSQNCSVGGELHIKYAEWELVDGSNASTSGDFVVDTPPDPNLAWCSSSEGYFDCSNTTFCDWLELPKHKDPNCDIYEPDWSNYMHSFSSPCTDHFSTGQGSRMRAVIDALHADASEKVKEITINSDTEWNVNRYANNIIIKEGVKLSIKNMTLEMYGGSSIFLERGATLYVEHATLTSQEDCNWEGIKTQSSLLNSADNITIQLEIGTVIENATIGVNLPFNDFEITLNTSYAQFNNCDIGIQYSWCNPISRIYKTDFLNNQTGINIQRCHGDINIASSNFIDNTVGVATRDAYIRIRYGSLFQNNEKGIIIRGTSPLVAGIQIGDPAIYNNQFISNGQDIVSSGSDHPLGVQIINNHFSAITTDWASTSFFGANKLYYSNNKIEDCYGGAFLWSTGDNESHVDCNDYINNYIDNGFINDNSNTVFLQNQSSGNQYVNNYFAGATMKSNIGSPSNAAANCFESNVTDLFTEPFGGNPGTAFNYYYYDDSNTDNCQEPTNSGNYSKMVTNNEGNNCQLGIGILDLIDPDMDGESGIDLDVHDPDIVCKPCILQTIDQWIITVVKMVGMIPEQ